MEKFKEVLSEKLQAEGFKAEIVSINRIKELEEEIVGLHNNGSIEDEFYRNNLSNFTYDHTKDSPDVKSIIIIAMPQKITKLSFKWKDKLQKVIIPPTYVSTNSDKKAFEILEGSLKAEGYRLYKVKKIPLKLLSVRSGLSMYGKNNITYIPEMGSFNRIIAFGTDMICEKDNWREAVNMSFCDSCNICVGACPTGCIDSDRFLIHAENCLTNINEYEGSFPEWIDSKWHNSLIGCMECQIMCPQNANHIDTIEIENAFEEDEISDLLNNLEFNKLSDKTKNTLANLDLIDYYKDNVLSRNLEALIEN